MPFSISSFAASSGDKEGSGCDLEVLAVKPRFWGGRERRTCSTESRARSARTLTVLMMSSRRDWRDLVCGQEEVVKEETHDWRVAEVLC